VWAAGHNVPLIHLLILALYVLFACLLGFPRLLFYRQIARSARRRYLIYSEADFEVFRPAGEIWHGGGDPGSPPPCQISPHLCNGLGIGPPKLKFLLRFDQNVEYKRPAVAYALRDFHKICIICTPFQDVLAVSC